MSEKELVGEVPPVLGGRMAEAHHIMQVCESYLAAQRTAAEAWRTLEEMFDIDISKDRYVIKHGKKKHRLYKRIG